MILTELRNFRDKSSLESQLRVIAKSLKVNLSQIERMSKRFLCRVSREIKLIVSKVYKR